MNVVALLAVCLFSPPAAESLAPAESWPIELDSHHVQGLAMSPEHLWITSVEGKARRAWVFRLDRKALRLVEKRELTKGPRYHPGGCQWAGGRLVVPVAEYRPKSTTTVHYLDPVTLATLSSFEVSDHLGAIASDGTTTLYAANWDAREFMVLNKNGEIRSKIPSPTGAAYQDVEFHGGRLYASGMDRKAPGGLSVVDVFEPAETSLRHVARYTLAGRTRTGAPFGREGFTFFENSFFLLPEDGPNTTLYRFETPMGSK